MSESAVPLFVVTMSSSDGYETLHTYNLGVFSDIELARKECKLAMEAEQAGEYEYEIIHKPEIGIDKEYYRIFNCGFYHVAEITAFKLNEGVHSKHIVPEARS